MYLADAALRLKQAVAYELFKCFVEFTVDLRCRSRRRSTREYWNIFPRE